MHRNATPLHGTERWRRLSKQQLRNHPLCAMCLKEGQVEPAMVADHIVPHHGDERLFWFGDLQSLCYPHHNGTKRQIENNGFARDIGPDGWPSDPNHPVNKIEK